MEWQIILAIALATPIVLLAAAFVWYVNVSGLYHVMRDAARRQQRTKARAMKEATVGVTKEQ